MSNPNRKPDHKNGSADKSGGNAGVPLRPKQTPAKKLVLPPAAAKSKADAALRGKQSVVPKQPQTNSPSKVAPKLTQSPKGATAEATGEGKSQGDSRPPDRPPVPPAGNLSKILAAENTSEIQRLWDATKPAGDFAPLPAGEYVARFAAGARKESKSRGTQGYEIEFQVIEGEHAGRRIWHDVWLTPLAISWAKRDLAKLGIVSPEQLDQPIQQGFVCAVKLVLRTEDDGTQRNKVRSFDVLRIETPAAEPFAPVDEPHDDDADGEGGGL